MGLLIGSGLMLKIPSRRIALIEMYESFLPSRNYYEGIIWYSEGGVRPLQFEGLLITFFRGKLHSRGKPFRQRRYGNLTICRSNICRLPASPRSTRRAWIIARYTLNLEIWILSNSWLGRSLRPVTPENPFLRSRPTQVNGTREG